MSTGVLQEALWGDAPPQAAATSLRVYVHRLRRVLGHPRVRLRDEGYSLQVEPGEVDVEDFQTLVTRGRAALAAGDPPAGTVVLREALALWRGAALEGLTAVSVLHETGAAYEELRLETVEQCVEAELALGRAGGLVAELQALVGQHPFREALRGQLMVALYRAGRQADALAEYRRAGQALREPRFRTEFAATLLLAGETVAARAMAEEALRIGQRYRLPYLTARAQACLADCTADADPALSRRLLEQARDTFARLGAPELDEIEKRLATTGPDL